MKRLLFTGILIVLLTGCDNPAIETTATDNAKINVDKLFTNDGCTVYRFYDNDYDHYYANCYPGMFGRHSNGKSSIENDAPTTN